MATDFSRVVLAPSRSSAPTLACHHRPETCPLSRPLWDLEVGAGGEESQNQDVLENLARGSSESILQLLCGHGPAPLPPFASSRR